MLNKLDDVFAPNICLFILTLCCLVQLVLLFLMHDSISIYITTGIFLATLLFTIKVAWVSAERKRVYSIIKNRISKRGYSKDILTGKCASICLLSQAVYISFRFKSYGDFYYFFQEHRRKEQQYIAEDENLERVLNQIDFSNTSAGDVVHEFEK